MNHAQKIALEARIVADLQNPKLLYTQIALAHKVGIKRVYQLAQKYSLTRKRGRKPGWREVK